MDPAALRYTLDNDDLQVLPSFGIVAPTFHETDPPPLDLPGCDINLSQVVHGSQEIEVAAPLPAFGSAVLRTRITDVWDKGKAAVIWQEGQALSAEGDALWTVRSSIFVRGEGGWGGDRGSSTKVEVPDRAPDCDASYDVTPQQALLYRLCGDRNPLHADPAFAEAAGFPAPILHGLCSYGIVLRTVTDELFGGDVAQGARASTPASPAWSSPARRSGSRPGTPTRVSSSRRRSPVRATATVRRCCPTAWSRLPEVGLTAPGGRPIATQHTSCDPDVAACPGGQSPFVHTIDISWLSFASRASRQVTCAPPAAAPEGVLTDGQQHLPASR